MTNLNSSLKSRTFVNKGLYSQSYGFSSSHVWMWELDHKEGRDLNNWCFQNVVPEKTLENPLECKEIKPVSPKGNQSLIFIGRTDAIAEAPPDVKSHLIGKDPDAGKDWGQEEEGAKEDKWLGGVTDSMDMGLGRLQEGVGDGQGGLEYCSPWDHKESDTT